MTYKELARYFEYDIPYIEIYNEQGLLEYVLDLNSMELEDVDIEHNESGYYGIIKLYRDNEKSKLDDKKL